MNTEIMPAMMNNLFLFDNPKSILLLPNGFLLFKKDADEKWVSKNHPDTALSFLPLFAKDFFELNDHGLCDVDIIVNILPAVLIPKPLFNKSAAFDALSMQYDISALGQLLTDETGEYTGVYFLRDNELDILKKINITPHFVHLMTLLTRQIISENVKNQLFLFIHEPFVEIILGKEKKIILSNRFNYTSDFDILYFTMNLLKQFEIKPEDCRLKIYPKPEASLRNLLGSYFSDFHLTGN